jgi:hypothetical protein
MNEPAELFDKKRLEAVRNTGLLGSPREAEFDRLTRLAAHLLEAPAAFVTVISDDQQYIKSAETGDDPDLTGASQPLEASFCKFAVASKKPLIIEDARQNELVSQNKAVAAGVIAYAGIPLQTHEGEAFGALCVVDSKPRQWSANDIHNLHLLARSAMKLVDERGGGVEREVAGEDTAGTHIADDLLECAGKHLRALDEYSALLRGSGYVDLDEEMRLRSQVVQTYGLVADMSRQLSDSQVGQESRPSGLRRAVDAYIAASAEREQAGLAFGQGDLELTTLEAAIRKQNDALDALRITALHLGADF